MKKKINYYEYLKSIRFKKLVTVTRLLIPLFLLILIANVYLYMSKLPHIFGYVVSFVLFAIIIYSIHCFLDEIKYFNPDLRQKQIIDEFFLFNKEKNLLFLQKKSISNGSVHIFNESNRAIWESLEEKFGNCDHRTMLIKLQQEYNVLSRKISKLRWEMRCTKICTEVNNFWEYSKSHSYKSRQEQIEAF